MPQYGTYAVPRVDIGGAFEEWVSSQTTYIATRVLPVLEVDRESGTFSAITREALMRRHDVKRAADGSYNRDTFDAEDVAYSTTEKGVECKSDDTLVKKYQNDFDTGRLSAQCGIDWILREQEVVTALAVFNTTTWASYYTDYSVLSPWTTTTTDVVLQINAAKLAVFNRTGIEPRTLIINFTNALRLLNIDDFQTRASYAGLWSQAALANQISAYLDVDEVIIGKGAYNAASEGGTISVSSNWSNLYAMLAVVAPVGSAGRTPCIGRTCVWSADSPATVQVEQYRDETVRSDVFRVRQYCDLKIIAPEFGQLLKVAAS